MSILTETTTTFTCDRCDQKQDKDGAYTGVLPIDWEQLGLKHRSYLLCPSCCSGLMVWMSMVIK